MPRLKPRERKDYDDEIRIYQAVHLVQMVPFMVSGNLLGIAASVLNNPAVVAQHYVYIPYAVLALLMLPMLINWRKLRYAPWPAQVSETRIRRASQHAALTGIAWGAAFVMTFPFLNAQEQSMYMGIVGVMMVGAASAIARVPMSGLGFGLPIGIAMLVTGIPMDQTPNKVVSIGVMMAILAYTLVLRFNWLSFIEHMLADTGRRKLQDKLTAHELAAAAQRQLIAAVPFPLVVTRGPVALFASPAAAKVFGITEPALNNTSVPNSKYFALPADYRLFVERQQMDLPIEEMETQFYDAKGQPFWGLITSRRIRYGGEDAWMNAILPIDERKKAEQELAVAKEKAERASHAKTDFLASMSHELRTPLNAIIGYSEILLEEAEEEALESYAKDLRKIRTSGRHILALINDILDITKIEAGKMELTPEHVKLADLVSDANVVIRRLMDKNDNEFRVEITSEIDTLLTDVTKARQIVINLLSNAGKFTSGGKVVLRVESERRDGTDWLRFIVSDTGIGIAADKIEAIFDEFNRGDSNTSRHFGGTGLGLALSRRIARLLGGDITASSEIGKGSIFVFAMPARLETDDLP